MDVIERTNEEEDEIEVYEDGTWAPIIEKDDKTTEVAGKRNAPDRNGLSQPGMRCFIRFNQMA